MTAEQKNTPVIVRPNEGRTYPMGRMSAVFKADLDETNSSLSVSEWWLEPDTEGPHPHAHPEAHVFYVIEGALSVYIENEWKEAAKGSYIYIPGGIEHTFENRSHSRVGFIAINTPGGFESSLPSIVSFLDENPLGSASGKTNHGG